jgi:hypothetical protein
VSAANFQLFVEAINGDNPTITNENVADIELLCQEFGYEELSAAVSKFLAQHSSDGDRACREISAMKAQNVVLTVEIAQQPPEKASGGYADRELE